MPLRYILRPYEVAPGVISHTKVLQECDMTNVNGLEHLGWRDVETVMEKTECQSTDT